LYVAQNGNDANDGTTMGNAFANIHVALAAATQWTTVFLKSGDYRLYNQPVTIPTRVALIGDNLRTTTIRPSQPSVDMFYVNNACYVTGITFRDHVSPSAVFSYNPDGSAGTIVTSPYILYLQFAAILLLSAKQVDSVLLQTLTHHLEHMVYGQMV